MSSSFDRQGDHPLYSKILWNRPLNRSQAGRLLLVGGQQHDFSVIQSIYQLAQATGIGQCQVVLPDVLSKELAGMPDVVFVPTSPSGSLSRSAAAQIIHLAAESDAVGLGGNLTKSSETSILVERVLSESRGRAAIYDDAIEAIKLQIDKYLQSDNRLIIITMRQLFMICSQLGIPINIQDEPDLLARVAILRDLTERTNDTVALIGSRHLIVAKQDQLTSTEVDHRLQDMPAAIYGVMLTYWTWNPAAPYEAAVTAAYVLRRAMMRLAEKPALTYADLAAAVTKASEE